MPQSFQDLPLNLQLDLYLHWSEASPQEAIGLVLTDFSTVRLKNWSKREDRFLVSHLQVLIRMGWRAYRRGEGILYVYHSHSVTSEPSSTDKRFMAFMAGRWPKVGHLIFVPNSEYSIWQYGG